MTDEEVCRSLLGRTLAICVQDTPLWLVRIKAVEAGSDCFVLYARDGSAAYLSAKACGIILAGNTALIHIESLFDVNLRLYILEYKAN